MGTSDRAAAPPTSDHRGRARGRLGRRGQPVRVLALAAVVALGAGACARDEGATVRKIGETASPGGTGSGTGTGASGTGAAPGGAPLGGYAPASDIASHARVTADVCDIGALLPSGGPMDYAGARGIYADGKGSVKADGSKRTLKGYATSKNDEPLWNLYTTRYGDQAWLDTFVAGALDGTGAFSGQADAVRRQGVLKGVQNQILVSWVFHELDAAVAKAKKGETDPKGGAPHAVDEAWAFYHGEKPECSPHATAKSRGENFGTGTGVNDAVLEQMERARDAAGAGKQADLQAAADEIVRQVTITYVQAAIRYSARIDAALAGGKEGDARADQAEGWAFFRVIEPLVARADAGAAATIDSVLNLKNAPSTGSGEKVRTALESVYGKLEITKAEVGTPQ